MAYFSVFEIIFFSLRITRMKMCTLLIKVNRHHQVCWQKLMKLIKLVCRSAWPGDPEGRTQEVEIATFKVYRVFCPIKVAEHWRWISGQVTPPDFINCITRQIIIRSKGFFSLWNGRRDAWIRFAGVRCSLLEMPTLPMWNDPVIFYYIHAY